MSKVDIAVEQFAKVVKSQLERIERMKAQKIL